MIDWGPTAFITEMNWKASKKYPWLSRQLHKNMFPTDCKIDVFFHGNILRGFCVWGCDYSIKRVHRPCLDKVALWIRSSNLNKSTSATLWAKPALNSVSIQREAASICLAFFSFAFFNYSGMFGENREVLFLGKTCKNTNTHYSRSHWRS